MPATLRTDDISRGSGAETTILLPVACRDQLVSEDSATRHVQSQPYRQSCPMRVFTAGLDYRVRGCLMRTQQHHQTHRAWNPDVRFQYLSFGMADYVKLTL